MSHRSGGLSNRAELFTARSDAGQSVPSAMSEAKSPGQNEDMKSLDDNPLQLDRMAGFAGLFSRTVIACPTNEDLCIKRFVQISNK